MPSITITNIPTIMRAHRFGNGARLMDIWFSRPATIAPAYGPPETSTIRMDSWALTFPRAKQVYDQLMKDKIWANAPAQAEIAAMLRRKGMLMPGGLVHKSFGNLTNPVQLQDDDYINYRTVGFGVFDLDDMSAALGNFSFRVVVSGSVTAVATNTPAASVTEYKVTIKEVGVYIRDSYDFNGSQFLGFWDDSDNTVSMVNPLSGVSVWNSDFCDWRRKNSRGGDFIVFSDIKRTVLAIPDTFIIK